MDNKIKEGIVNGMIDKAEIQHEWIELQADAYKLYEGIQATCNAFYQDSAKHFQPFKERLRPIIELMGIYIFGETDGEQ